METFSGHELATSVDCKVPLCTNEAAASRGRYAGLCELHRLERRNGSPEPQEDAPRNGSYEFHALGLVELARELDAAFAAYQPAREAFAAAAQRWAQAVEQLASAGVNGVAKPGDNSG